MGKVCNSNFTVTVPEPFVIANGFDANATSDVKSFITSGVATVVNHVLVSVGVSVV